MFDVITIGTATRDVFLRSNLFKVLKDAVHLRRIGFETGEAECFALGSKIEIEPPIFTVGGGAANAAVTFARQGFRTTSLFRIGNDYEGKQAIEYLKREKVRTFPAYDSQKGTAWSCVLLSPGGERTILNYRGASEGITKKDVSSGKLKTRWAYVVPGRISFSTISFAVNHFKKIGARIALNPSKAYIEMGIKKLKGIFDCTDVILINREEASYLTGIRYGNVKGIFRRLDKYVHGIAVMTDGEKGAYVSDGHRVYEAGTFSEEKLVDRTGAGDAFGSGFVAGMIRTNNIEHAIRLASANATSVVEHIGAQTGILTKKGFQGARWRKFRIRVKNI